MTTATKATHTPGPWRLDEGDNDIRDSGGELIACAYGFLNAHDKVEYTPVTKANARLIAAAPEMLEALEGIFSDGFNWKLSESCQDRIRAAIAKARGGA